MVVSSRAPGPPAAVGVLGAGTMGAGIALAFARAGSRAVACTRTEHGARRARDAATKSLRQLVDCGQETPGRISGIAERIRFTTSLRELDRHTELVIESIPERLADKRRLVAEVETAVPPEAVITSNTSSLPLAELAAVLRRPGQFAGFHWFNPAELVQLVEIVPTPRTSEATVRALQGWSAAVGKRAVTLARDSRGFVANRLQYALIREAYALVEAGVCAPGDVDEVVRAGLGPRWAAVGPFESMDLAGLDVHLEVARQLFPALSASVEPPAMVESLVHEGALGIKSGRGILGGYDERDIAELGMRRARLLTIIAQETAASAARPRGSTPTVSPQRQTRTGGTDEAAVAEGRGDR